MFGWNMIPCLLIAGLLGGWIGWLLKSLLFGNKEQEYEGRINELESSWGARWKTKTGEFDALQANFNTQGNRLSLVEADYATANANLKERDALLLDWEARYKKLEASGSAENAKDDAEIADLKARLAKAESAQQAKDAELTTAKQGIAGKEKELAALAASVAALEIFRTKAGDWETKHKSDIGARDAELAKAKASITDWETRYRQMEASALAENRKDNSEIAMLKTQVERAKADLDASAKTVAARDAELNSLRGNLADWESKYKSLQASANAENTKDDKEIADLKAQLARLQSDLSARDKAANDANAQLTATRQNLTGKEAELAKLTASIAALEVFHTKTGEWETKYKTDIGNKDSEIGNLKARITELEMLTSAPKKPDWTDLILIEGIGDVYYKKLSGIGISWQKELLKRGADKEGRQAIAAESGIREDMILTWVNHCDLRRVNGISEQFAELLEVAGVDTMVELATRRPDNLFNKLVEVNTEKHVSPTTPIAEEVQSWVAQAKTLGRVVTH